LKFVLRYVKLWGSATNTHII